MMTLIFVRAHYVNGRLAHYPGEECPPGMFSQENIDRALDQGYLKEYDADVRPSLYRTLYRFTGATPEQPLTREQIARYTLADPPDNSQVENPPPTRDHRSNEAALARFLRLT